MDKSNGNKTTASVATVEDPLYKKQLTIMNLDEFQACAQEGRSLGIPLQTEDGLLNPAVFWKWIPEFALIDEDENA